MTNYKVLHYVHPLTRTEESMDITMDAKISAINEAFFKSGNPNYKAVANVVAKDLDDVFRKTNHITYNWMEGLQEDEEALVESARSTSIGDIIFDLDSGSTYAVATFGFKQLS